AATTPQELKKKQKILSTWQTEQSIEEFLAVLLATSTIQQLLKWLIIN
ncbi:MAG: hypothetical protein ACI9N9_002399, partial [Enterobacterales bacterium]